MRVPRPASAALAALLAGSVAQASLARAAAEPPAATVEPARAVAPPADPTLLAPPSTPSEAVGVAPETAPETAPGIMPAEAATPSAPDPHSAGSQPAAESTSAPQPAGPPTEPLPAAVFARLGEPKALLARLPAREREAIRAHYERDGFKPLWIADGALTPAAQAVAARLAAAAEDGLDPRAYPVPALAGRGEAEAAATDVALTAAAVLYARDARGGRVNLAAISKLVTPSLDLPATDAVLGSLAEAGSEAGERLRAYNPATAGYRALRARLSANRRAPSSAGSDRTLVLPPGPTLRLGMHDPRVATLRAHFGLAAHRSGTLDAGPGEPDAYDADVAAAVSAFQRRRGLPGHGVLNVRTVLALANAEARPEAVGGGGDDAALIVNMERWRWLPGELGPDYVLVNIPEYRLRVFRGGSLREEARVIVGKTESPTPLFSGMMEYAVVNPSWYVPPSILKTMAPRLAGYGGRTWGGYEVVRRGGHVSLRQPPGERNALGFIKFMFPNQHAVYLHDTPNRSLFSAAKRAFSHGCVRVDDPFRFADAVLPDWSEERLKKLIGKGERTIRLPAKLPVHLAYFTATVDDGGQLRTLPDLYGYDAPMRAALGLPGGAKGTDGAVMARLPAEPARRTAHAEPTRAKPVRRVQRASRYADRPPTRRAARADVVPDYGEPGLWTPQPTREPHSWW